MICLSKMDTRIILLIIFFVGTNKKCLALEEERLILRLGEMENKIESVEKENQVNSVLVDENAQLLNETKVSLDINHLVKKSCRKKNHLVFLH